MSTERTTADTDSPAEQSREQRSTVTAVVLAVLFAPIAYYYAGSTKWAIINLLTLNYLMLGVVIAPIHVYAIVSGSDS